MAIMIDIFLPLSLRLSVSNLITQECGAVPKRG